MFLDSKLFECVSQSVLKLGNATLMSQDDREFMLLAVKLKGTALCAGTPRVRNDLEVVDAAIKNQIGYSVI